MHDSDHTPYATEGLPIGYGIATGVAPLLRSTAMSIARLAAAIGAVLLVAALIDVAVA